jgi:hypothetical protein
MNLSAISNALRRHAHWGLAIGALVCAPSASQAQSAIIYGQLSNFDISNDTGRVCHGFDIDIDGVTPADVPYGFTATRYGTPTITATATGTKIHWESPFDAHSGQWATRTLQHTVSWFPGQCYSWVPATYEDGGCEHFGSWTTASTTKVTSRWLCEDPSLPAGQLMPMNPPTAVPYADYVVQPAARAADPPQLVADVDAPEPAEAPDQYGNAQWERTFIMELPRTLTVDELVADNPAAVPMNLAQLESDYQILQDEPVSGGNGRRKRHRHQSAISPTTRAIVRRIELWNYTGNYDPITNEAICLDGLCNTPDPSELGEMISVQMTAANVTPDSVVVTKVGNGNVDSSDKTISCGSKCGATYAAGTVVTLTAKANSGSVFSGWNGGCAGTGTCTVTANGINNVGATFTVQSTGGGGGGGGATGGGGGGGTTTTNRTVSVKSAGGKGLITSNVGGINCGKTCSATVANNTSVTLTATPEPGFQFASWTGACTANGNTCTLAVTANTSIQANFIKP